MPGARLCRPAWQTKDCLPFWQAQRWRNSARSTTLPGRSSAGLRPAAAARSRTTIAARRGSAAPLFRTGTHGHRNEKPGHKGRADRKYIARKPTLRTNGCGIRCLCDRADMDARKTTVTDLRAVVARAGSSSPVGHSAHAAAGSRSIRRIRCPRSAPRSAPAFASGSGSCLPSKAPLPPSGRSGFTKLSMAGL